MRNLLGFVNASGDDFDLTASPGMRNRHHEALETGAAALLAQSHRHLDAVAGLGLSAVDVNRFDGFLDRLGRNFGGDTDFDLRRRLESLGNVDGGIHEQSRIAISSVDVLDGHRLLTRGADHGLEPNRTSLADIGATGEAVGNSHRKKTRR